MYKSEDNTNKNNKTGVINLISFLETQLDSFQNMKEKLSTYKKMGRQIVGALTDNMKPTKKQ